MSPLGIVKTSSPKRTIPGSQSGAAGGSRSTPAAPTPFKINQYLFDKQLKFIQDPHPFKIAVCSRRSGKTVACAADLVDTAISYPGVNCLYITITRSNAKKLVWPEIQKLNRLHGLGGSEDLTELSMTFPNGSTIYCSGAKDSSEIEKFRGLALKKCYIDECQSFREFIGELIDDVISPALLDYAGTLCLIGTPGPIPAGYFAEVAGQVKDRVGRSEAWSQYGWTFFDNPHIEIKSGFTHQQLLNRELKRRGVSIDDPGIQREYFGRWVLDSEALWIKYNQDLNHYTELPPGKYNYILGIDLGFMDADALAVLAWSEQSPVTYLVDEVISNKQGLAELVDQINHLKNKYDISRMIIDEGGLGKKLAEEMRRRHGLPVEAADKARKQENVAFLNDSLRTGMFKAKGASRFAQDSYKVEIDYSKSKPDKIVVSDKYHSDIIDAVLYAFKESPTYSYQVEAVKPLPGSPEWCKAQSNEMFNSALEHFKEQAELQDRVDNMGFGRD